MADLQVLLTYGVHRVVEVASKVEKIFLCLLLIQLGSVRVAKPALRVTRCLGKLSFLGRALW
jgi:hypothetical protein